NSQLAGREVGVKILQKPHQTLCSATAACNESFDTRDAYAHQRKLSGHEKAVGGDEHKHRNEFEDCGTDAGNHNASNKKAQKAHECLVTLKVLFVPVCWLSDPRPPRPRGHELDDDRVCCGRARVPDRRGVRYCTRADDTRPPTPKLRGSVNVRASVVREKREV